MSAMATVLTKMLPLNRVADALGVSIFTVRRLVDSNSISAVRIGGRVMVSSVEVERVQREGTGSRKRSK